MPESVSTVDAILDGLRDRSFSLARPGDRRRVVFVDRAVAAVHAAADTRTREDEQTMYAGRICADALMGKIAAQDVLIAAIERCRRFPVSDCDTTSTNEAAGETPTSATPDR